VPEDHPLKTRYHAARNAIVSARPTDLAGLAVQLRYFQDTIDVNEPNEDEKAMLDHVAGQLEALAGRDVA
jgi:hypothetical protein